MPHIEPYLSSLPSCKGSSFDIISMCCNRISLQLDEHGKVRQVKRPSGGWPRQINQLRQQFLNVLMCISSLRHSILITLIMASCMVIRPFGMRAFRPLRRRPSSLHLTAYDLCTHSRLSMSLSGIQYSFHRILNNVLPSDSQMSVAVSTCDQSTVALRLLFGKGWLGMRRILETIHLAI